MTYTVSGGALNSTQTKFRYTDPIADALRHELKFRRELRQFSTGFLAANIPPGWSRASFVRVAVHIRRGDFLQRRKIRKGFTTATPRYLRRATGYFVERFARVQFVVASNDIPWCRLHLRSLFPDPDRVNVTFSEGHSAGEDLALLTSCNHAVISTGTYGWWAAWLIDGMTVYYADFPRKGSSLGIRSRVKDYYPSSWIAING